MRKIGKCIKRREALQMAMTLLLLLIALTLSACHDDHDDYYTTAIVTIDLPEGSTIRQMQGTVTLTNLNNKQAYSSSTFNGTSVTLEVMRGVYSADVEGSLRYTDSEGTAHAGNFRASTSHCEMLNHPSELHLDIILL